MATHKATVVLVDGSSYLFRAYYALPPLSNKSGQPTNAILGVVRMLKKLVAAYNPAEFAVVFDSPVKNFRYELFSDYKANRTIMPEDLQSQIQPLFNIIKYLGFQLIIIDGVEADDVIATLAKNIAKQNKFAIVSTGDKDLAQIVNDKITLVNTMNEVVLDYQGVIDKFGVTPEQIIDYLTLIGDTVDNIPGVHKVGPKTAVKWLQEYGNLDNIIANAEQIKGVVGDNLRASLKNLDLYKQLITIKDDVVIPDKFLDLSLKNSNNIELKKIYRELEFNSLLKELDNNLDEVSIDNNHNTVEIITKQDGLLLLEQALQGINLIALDLITKDSDNIIGVAVAAGNKRWYIALRQNNEQIDAVLYTAILQFLKKLLGDTGISKIGYNLKNVIKILLNYDITVNGEIFDILLASYVLSSVEQHSLEYLAKKYLDYDKVSLAALMKKLDKGLDFSYLVLDDAANYMGQNAHIIYAVHQILWQQIVIDTKLKAVFCEIEMPLCLVLVAMERYGIFLDVEKLRAQSQELHEKLLILEEQAYKLAGVMFNLNSPKQLQEVLFGKLGLPIISKTPSGQASTAEEVLQELSVNYELPRILLEYRSLSKLKTTYTDKLPEEVNSKTHRIHTTYQQAVTSTGRLASIQPNLQNIPIKTQEGRKIRGAFIAPPGFKLVSLDYSQIELRLMAHLSDDHALQQLFLAGHDIHLATASIIFHKELTQVSKDERRFAKAINFGLIYGMSAFGLSKHLNISVNEAEAFMQVYFGKFAGVKQYIITVRERAKVGYVETLFGRRLYLPDLNSKNMALRKASERAAINGPMQGTQADIIKIAMIKIQNYINQHKLAIKMLLQVHDELVFEVRDDLIELAITQCSNLMSQVVQLKVQLVVNSGVGQNWDDAHS